jgi:hypothetical protein
MNRREFVRRASLATCSTLLPAFSGLPLGAAEPVLPPVPAGKAEHCIMIWLGGGMAQIDTFDAKKIRGDGKKVAGCYYDTIETAIPGALFCEHLPNLARRGEFLAPVRTVHHNVIDEHAAATNRMHTGRPTSGSLVYPSIGSLVAATKRAAADGIPPYVVMGYPSATRGPGFLGPKAGFVYLTDTAKGPEGLSLPPDISTDRAGRRESLLATLRRASSPSAGRDPALAAYGEALDQCFALQNGDFLKAFQLASEKDSTRAAFGDEFGQRCLLARRLLQRGVRFVEVGFNLNFVNGAGWDTHNAAQRDLHVLIKGLDHVLSTLIDDLKTHGLLEKTLLVVSGEFGRPAEFDSGGGRGHHGKCFTVLLGGGGIKTGQCVGESNELAMAPVADPVSVPDLFATILNAMGVDPAKKLMDGERPVPVTDGGRPVRKLFV